MGGSTLLVAPVCLTLIIWVTYSHLRGRRKEALKPFPAAWLLAPSSDRRGPSNLALTQLKLWLARVLLLALLCTFPEIYRPWLALFSAHPAPQGTLVITSGPLSVKAGWERPVWVALKSPAQLSEPWVTEEGRASSSPAPLPRDVTWVPLPYQADRRSPAESGDLEDQLRSHMASLQESLSARGAAPRRTLIVTAPSPQLLAARLSWGQPEPSQAQRPQLTLELHTQSERARSTLGTIKVELRSQRGWERILELKSQAQEASPLQLKLPASAHKGLLRVCLERREDPSAQECLRLTPAPWLIRASRAGWPEAFERVFKVTPGLERSSEERADWLALDAQELPRHLSRGVVFQTDKPLERHVVFTEGSAPQAPIWGQELSSGVVGALDRWEPLSPYDPAQLASLRGAPHPHIEHRSLYLAPLPVGSRRAQLSPVIDELNLNINGKDRVINRLAWRAQKTEDLTLISELIARWAHEQRTRTARCCGERRSITGHSRRARSALASLSSSPAQPQRERVVSPLSASSNTPASQTLDGSPLTRLALVISALMILMIRRAPLSLLSALSGALWLISAAPEGSALRGIGGLWRGSPTARVVSVGYTDEGRRSSLALRNAWGLALRAQGVHLSSGSAPSGLTLYMGGEPLGTSGRRWVIPSPQATSRSLQISSISSAWSADQSGLWISAQLSRGPLNVFAHSQESPAAARYELWLQGAEAEELILSCEEARCSEQGGALYLKPKARPSPLHLTLSLYRREGGAEPTSPASAGAEELTLIDERDWSPPPRPSLGEAWSWSPQSAAWLREAGYAVPSAPPDALKVEVPAQVQLISVHDTPASRMSTQAIERLERWVSAGGTLFLSGLHQSFEEGGWLGTPLDRLSPFISQARSASEARVTFLIDVSGSLSREAGGLGVRALVEESLKLAAQLPSQDEVVMISFAGEAALLLPPTKVSELSAVIAPAEGSGGSLLQAGLHEALRWLGERGPQRWLLLSDGELSAQGLTPIVERLRALQAQQDLSVYVALTSESPPSPEGERALTLLTSQLSAQLGPLSQLSPATFSRWRNQSEAAQGSSGPFKVWATTPGRRLGAALPPVSGSARVQLKPGATLLAERAHAQGRRPLLAEWRYGLGRVIALATDQWAPPPQTWGALLSSAQATRSHWRFSWELDPPLLIARGPSDQRLKGRGVLVGHEGEVVSGRWRPLFNGESVFLSQDGGPLDERVGRFEWLELRARTSTSAMSVARLSRPPAPSAHAELAHLPLPYDPERYLVSEREASAPSGALIRRLTQAASSPEPLPSRWLALLLLALTCLDVRRWRAQV